MDLKDFVRDALVQIVTGISEARQLSQGKALINPRLKLADRKTASDPMHALDAENLKQAGLLQTNYGDSHADMFEFDVAITVEKSNSAESEGTKKGESGLKIAIVSAGVDIAKTNSEKSEESRSHVSRVKFRVPVMLPN